MNGINNIKLEKSNPRKGLLKMLNEILKLEQRASQTYINILGNESLTSETREVIKKIQRDEEGHVKIAKTMIKLIKDYDFNMEIIKY